MNGIKLVGVIDLLALEPDNYKVTVTDFKTSWAFPSRDDVEKSLQFGIYSLYVAHAYPNTKEIILRLDNLRYGKAVTTGISTDGTITVHPEMIEFLTTTAMQIDGMTEFKPTLNANCVYCSYRHDCPGLSKALQWGEPETPEEMAERYFALKKMLEIPFA